MQKVITGARRASLSSAGGHDWTPARTVFAPISATHSTSGEMPTSGGMRPGPAGTAPPPLVVVGTIPVAIKVSKADIDAQVEQQTIDDGKMHDPSGPYVVSWYKTTGKLGEANNIVMAGPLEWYGVAQAVFYHIGDLKKGDAIAVTGEDNETYNYKVDWLKDYVVADLDAKTIQQIVGPTQTEQLTLITCGGAWDADKQEYVERMVVRASRSS
jgi:LPXTG-site transpeptidase (sortase) family protein